MTKCRAGFATDFSLFSAVSDYDMENKKLWRNFPYNDESVILIIHKGLNIGNIPNGHSISYMQELLPEYKSNILPSKYLSG